MLSLSAAEVSLGALHQTHLDLQVLNKHLYSLVILRREWNNDVCILHGGANEVVVGRLDEPVVLGQHINHSPASLCNVSID